MRIAAFVRSVAWLRNGLTRFAAPSIGYCAQTIRESPLAKVPVLEKSALPDRIFTRSLVASSPIWFFARHMRFFMSVDAPVVPVR